jgi:copper chaperone
MAEKSYLVTGMTCEHCVRAVTDELLAVDGVDGVQVHLTSGLVTVTGSEFTDAQVLAAVDEAGYALADG